MKPNYEIRVGLFTIMAIILLIWGWGWLKSASLGHPPQRITVQFHDVAGLTKGAPVNINGVRVGTVDDIKLKAKGVVLVYLKITTEGLIVAQGSNVTIQTLGFVGAKYIEITLPTELAGQAALPPIPEDKIVIGDDPVRVELVINEFATKLSRVVKSLKGDKAGKSLAEALEHSGEAVKNINEASYKFNKNMDKLATTVDGVNATSDKFGKAANSASAFFNQGTQTMNSIGTTSKKVNKILDNPALSNDLKDTAQLAKQTADSIAVAVHDLNGTLRDETLRHDIFDILKKLDTSTANIYNSVKTVDGLARDDKVRGDIKDVISEAKVALTKANDLLDQPDFKSDLKETMGKVRTAADNVDVAARQLHQVLDQRAPLFHMMFGRPGYIKIEEKKVEEKVETAK